MQAQTLYAVCYKTIKQIRIPPWDGKQKYLIDIAYSGEGSVAVSILNTTDIASSVERNGWDVSWISNYGSYISNHPYHGGSGVLFSTLDSLTSIGLGGHNFKKEGYTPNGIAICKSGAFLVCLWNHAFGEMSQGLVVRLDSYGKEQFQIESDKNRNLFTCPTYVTENGNEDICVSDVGAVVVTDQGGMLKFRYEGLPEHQFDPYGICCDSGCNIIIADMKNDKIHVINQNGEFLHHIQYDGINLPRALCIDEADDLYVGEWNCDVIKVISSD